ncbi:MAG: rRNA maturation RNase YbeY [Phycisphaerales bacterium]|nr:rRNA maturation RNase YbeY [Phycisphaerales bacterium]
MNTNQPSIDVVSAIALDAQWLIDRITQMIPLLPPAGGATAAFKRISIRIVRDDEMSRLHETHSKVVGTTDVLTFVSNDEEGGIAVDLALCIDEARRCSGEFGHGIDQELALYALHGLLHAVGLRDHDAPSAKAMHDQEDRILAAIGVVAASAHHRENP